MSKIKTDAVAVPRPLELAILAALLRPRDVPTLALKAAMAFYIEAHRFCGELRSRTPESIFADFYSDQEWLKFSAEAFKKAQGELWADTLELRPNEDNDPARQFLEQQGLPLKTARGGNSQSCRREKAFASRISSGHELFGERGGSSFYSVANGNYPSFRGEKGEKCCLKVDRA